MVIVDQRGARLLEFPSNLPAVNHMFDDSFLAQRLLPLGSHNTLLIGSTITIRNKLALELGVAFCERHQLTK